MKPPPDKEIFEDELAEYWMETDELLCSICKPNPRTLEATKKSFELIEKITHGKKVCLLSDTTAASQGSEKVREYSLTVTQRHFKAMALITSSSFSNLLVNTFMTISKQAIPMRLFNNEKEAREWINQHELVS